MAGLGDGQGTGDDPRRHIPALIEARCSAGRAAEVRAFVERYYAGVAAEDLAGRTPADLYAAALAHWRLAARRAPGEPAVRVYNPDPEADGWESGHTVVDLVVEDRAFLTDSLTLALQEQGLGIHVLIHPLLPVRYAEDGAGLVREASDPAAVRTAFLHFEVDRRSSPEQLEALRERLLGVLADVATVVDDWEAMQGRLLAAAEELRRCPPASGDTAELEEIDAFLHWAAEHHFTFLGYRAYTLRRDAEGLYLVPDPDTALGLLRRASADASLRFAALPAEVQQRALEPEPLILTQSNARAPVHRRGHMDYLGVKRFDAQGRVIGEHRFLGLYTSAVYYRSAQEIPLLRRKVAAVLQRAGYPRGSHAFKALLNILEGYPRDELFQVETDELERIARAVLHLHERPRTRLLVRYDRWQRFASCLVFVPRERYDTRSRRRIQACLEAAFGAAESDFSVQLGESPLARLRFTVWLPEPGMPTVDTQALEQRLVALLRSWQDAVHDALLEAFGEERGTQLAQQRYAEAFPAAYQELVPAQAAARDVACIERLGSEPALETLLYRPAAAEDGELRLKLFHGARPASLSEALPVLEHMGLRVVDEQPFEVTPQGAPACWIHDFGLRWEGGAGLDPQAVGDTFRDAFAAVWTRRAESDGLNRLILAAGLTWQEVVLLRAYARYMRQLGTAFSQAYMAETLAAWPGIAARLVALFRARFAPEGADAGRAAACADAVREALHGVASLDEDRILRRFLAGVEATVRTNYATGDPEAPLALKLHPASLPDVPSPVPWAEIFVYAPHFEGVHLRGGDVARGGIRWSTRREDFRTEVLGLLKAQMVKNAAIVPVGAKGGFALRCLPAGREAQQEAGRAAYRAYVDAMLQLTDNLRGDTPVPPPRVVRHDGPDPYLVVAADKGTAAFSDLANSVSAACGFWLGDAFASGGSAGYDHKAMGITARGAWEAVRRHFRELGRDSQREPLTVAGIGDMSGDVFGNGMLCSRQIRLVAAFDHRHVFIDPDPEPAAAYAERQRLFALAGSSWDDYDRSVLSAGGGVFPRSAKSVALSPQARSALAIEAEALTPDELIQAVLCAPVDLLWNGGIGTYVKASHESHAQVDDKGADAVRVDAPRLRCRVVGEGGNLGLTQLARIEFAARGGRINTDAVDNVGGVACSDCEVNIKILLNEAVADGELSRERRDALLAEMTEEVAGLVLSTCRSQSDALGLAEAEANRRRDEHAGLMRRLERDGTLDRALEALPGDAALAERAADGAGLLRPELAVLLAYAKIAAQQALRGGALPDRPLMEPLLFGAFPATLGERLPERIRRHRLRRELVATAAANRVIDRMGETFLDRVTERTGADVSGAVEAWLVAEALLELDAAWQALAAEEAITEPVRREQWLALRALHEHATLWLLRHPEPIAGVDATTAIARLQPAIRRLTEYLDSVLPEATASGLAQERARLQAYGLPGPLARRLAALPVLYPALDWLAVADSAGAELLAVAGCHYRLVEALELSGLRRALAGLASQDGWQERFRDGLVADYDRQLRALVAQLVAERGADPAAVAPFLEARRPAAERLRRVLQEVHNSTVPGAAVLGVAVQELEALVQAGATRHPCESAI